MVFKGGVVALAIVALVVPFAAARVAPSKSSPSETTKCDEGFFLFTAIEACCLPENGSSDVSPPKGKSCPSSRYWSKEQGCCVPTTKPPPSNPEPQCEGEEWEWTHALQCCTPTSGPPTTTTPSHPSSTPTKPSGGEPYGDYPGEGEGDYPGEGEGEPTSGKGGYSSGNRYGKRQHTSRSLPACPKGLDACPISGLVSGDYECLDTTAELESCGGCASIGRGQDCTAIEGAWNVGCELGTCKVYTCFTGYLLSADSKSCVSL